MWWPKPSGPGRASWHCCWGDAPRATRRRRRLRTPEGMGEGSAEGRRTFIPHRIRSSREEVREKGSERGHDGRRLLITRRFGALKNQWLQRYKAKKPVRTLTTRQHAKRIRLQSGPRRPSSRNPRSASTPPSRTLPRRRSRAQEARPIPSFSLKHCCEARVECRPNQVGSIRNRGAHPQIDSSSLSSYLSTHPSSTAQAFLKLNPMFSGSRLEAGGSKPAREGDLDTGKMGSLI